MMIVTVDTDNMTVNEKGETLRGLVFDQRIDYGNHRLVGCYSTFAVNNGFTEIDPSKYPVLLNPFKPYDDSPYTIKVTAYESESIVAMWWWDGDGDLLIWIKGEPYAYRNGDCKCDYTWEEVEQ